MGLQRRDMLALLMREIRLEFKNQSGDISCDSRCTYPECEQFHLCIFTTRDQIRLVVLDEQLHASNLGAVRWRTT